MGKITDALRKAAEERIEHLEKFTKIKERSSFVVKQIGDSRVDPRIVTYFDAKATITEQYKILRTNVLALNKGKPPKIMCVTSSVHSEGKTITSINLAITLAHSTKKPKILLIDADMRRGKIAKYLGIENRAGLSEVLKGEVSPEDAMFKLDIENLTFMTAGPVPENPAELLDSDRMREFLADVRMKFDHIIIDTPPIIAVTDAGIVGSQAEGVIMAIQAGRTQRGVVRRATELLEQSRCNLMGYVLTNIESHLPEYIYRYL